MKEIVFLKSIVLKSNEITNQVFEVSNKGAESDLVTNLDLEIEQFLISEIKRRKNYNERNYD